MKKERKPSWWKLDLQMLILVVALFFTATVPADPSTRKLAEMVVMVVGFAWVALWLKNNATALEDEDSSQSIPPHRRQSGQRDIPRPELNDRTASSATVAGLKESLASAVRLLVLMTLLTGLAYPLVVTAVAQGLFPRQASGSLLLVEGQVVGSELIGQPFDDPAYFWSRPSTTQPVPYNAAASAGLNHGPTSLALVQAVTSQADALRPANGDNSRQSLPVDLVTASGSGLDPHISVAAALYQVPRVAAARALDEEVVVALVHEITVPRQLGVLGEPRVNVLRLNLALDELQFR